MADEVIITSSTRRTTSYVDGSQPTSVSGYRSSVAPRNVIIQRSTTYTGGPNIGGGSSISRQQGRNENLSAKYAMTVATSPASFSQLSTTGMTTVKSSREREKKDLQDLNERFASYIEKVRFLEAQNKRLTDELEKLKSRWGKETSQIKAMYQAELDELRRLLDESEKEKARLEIKTASLEEVLQETQQNLDDANRTIEANREQIDRQNKELSDYEGEINMLRRRVEGLENDREKDKKQIATLITALNSARANLDSETLSHIDAENRRQTLEEELEYMRTIHEQELKELAALAYRDTTAENRDFWKTEMGNALREIQEMYEEKLELMRTEIESSYSSKLQEFRTGATRQNMETVHSKEESKRLRGQMTELRDKLADLEAKNGQLQRELDQLRRQKEEMEREYEQENAELKGEIARLRAELESVLQELQHIMDTKLGLELEIAAYRKLLEGEESRVGLKKMVDVWSMGGGRSSSPAAAGSSDGSLQFSVAKGEISAKTTFQKTAKGPATISECAGDGKFVVLENSGRKDEELDGWSLFRSVDGIDKVDFHFPENTVLAPGSRITIWCAGCKPPSAPDTDIETDYETFGIGSNIVTKLLNPAGEDRATHVQKTVYC